MAALPAVAAQIPAHAAPSVAVSAQTLDAIAGCESGHRNINNSTYPVSSASGYWQMIDSTWLGNGGGQFAPRAIGATLAQQTVVAQRLAAANPSLSDWNPSRDCWGPKIDAPAAVVVTAAAHASNTPAPRHALHTGAARHSITVVAGDTLSGIALNRHVTVAELLARNRSVIGDNPDLIIVGQVLVA